MPYFSAFSILGCSAFLPNLTFSSLFVQKILSSLTSLCTDAAEQGQVCQFLHPDAPFIRQFLAGSRSMAR